MNVRLSRSVMLRHLVAVAFAYAAIAAPQARAASGDLDFAFATNGVAETDFVGGEDGARAVAIDAEGRIVAAGGGGVDDPSKPGSTAFSLARYMNDGSLDPSFGGDGRVQTDLGVQTQSIEAVMVDGLGRITAVGTATNFDGINSSITVVRYLEDGTLDGSFGSGGIVSLTPGFLNIARDALIGDRGDIVIAGLTDGPGGLRPTVLRLLSSGGPDPAFSDDGVLRIRRKSLAVVSAIAQSPGGGIVLAGASEGDRIALMSVQRSGRFDRKYGSRGGVVVATHGDSEANDLALLGGGVVVAGTCSCGTRGDQIAVAGVKARGRVDKSFAKHGLRAIALGGPDTTSRATAVIVDSGGRIVVGGVRDPSGPAIDGAVARLTPRGRLDRSFSIDGIAPPGNALNTVADLAQDPAGGILAAGQVTSTNLDSDFGVARYLP